MWGSRDPLLEFSGTPNISGMNEARKFFRPPYYLGMNEVKNFKFGIEMEDSEY